MDARRAHGGLGLSAKVSVKRAAKGAGTHSSRSSLNGGFSYWAMQPHLPCLLNYPNRLFPFDAWEVLQLSAEELGDYLVEVFFEGLAEDRRAADDLLPARPRILVEHIAAAA